MLPIKAEYLPRKYNDVGQFDGYEEGMERWALIVHIHYPNAVFITNDGRLDSAPIDCFRQCHLVVKEEQWKQK